MEVRKLSSRAAFGIEDVLVFFAVFLNILELFNILTNWFNLLDKLFALVLFSLLIYHLSPTKLFFGQKKPAFDIALLISYILLSFKSITYWAKGAQEETTNATLLSFLEIIKTIPDSLTLLIGALLILVISFITLFSFRIDSPSILSLILPPGQFNSAKKKILGFLATLLISYSFFIIIFNLIFEWLEIVIDAPIMMIVILLLAYAFIRHRHRVHAESLLFKIAETAEEYYEKIISHLTYKTTLFLGISAMLILHLLTDLVVFILPYLSPYKDTFYTSALGENPTLYHAISSDLLQTGILAIPLHLLNVTAIILFLCLPAYLWYLVYTEKPLRFPFFLIILFLMSTTAFLITPTFRITEVVSDQIVGVQILTQPLPAVLLQPAIIILTVGIITFLLSKSVFLQHITTFISLIVSLAFFTFYIFLFVKTVITYYLSTFTTLVNIPLLLIIFLIFFIIQLGFYTTGFFSFIHSLSSRLITLKRQGYFSKVKTRV